MAKFKEEELEVEEALERERQGSGNFDKKNDDDSPED